LVGGDHGALRGDLGLRLGVAALGGVDVQHGLGELGFGARHRDGEGGRIQREQELAFVHVLVVGDIDALDQAGDVGGERDFRGAHVGVVRADILAAGEPDDEGDDEHREHTAQHEDGAQAEQAVDAAHAAVAGGRGVAGATGVRDCAFGHQAISC
jgi:hypothetical protein